MKDPQIVEVVEVPIVGEGIVDCAPLLAPLIARVLLRAFRDGRLHKAPDGRLVPVAVPAGVDLEPACVVE